MKLTLPQQDIYFEQLMYPHDPIYNIGAKIAIKGNIIYEFLNEAYVILINQHDAYRSVIDQAGEEVAIYFKDCHDEQLKYVDFSNCENADREAIRFMQETFEIPFKLKEKEILHKFILIKVNQKFHYLFSVYHHIITDGWGTSLMFQRLVKNYNELAEHGKVTTEYPYTYKDFISDDQNYFLSQHFRKDKAYWTEKFKYLPEQLFEKIRSSGKQNQSKRKEIWIKRSTYNQLEQLGEERRCSTFHIILGVLFLYFGRRHQINDFVIGVPVLNRGKSVFKKTVGLFMGVSPLRMQFDFNDCFEDLVLNIKQQLRKDYRFQRFPLGKLVKELELLQEKERLFNITLSYEKQDYASHFIDTDTSVIPLSNHSERVALAIYIREFDEREDVKIDFEYNLNYFNETTANQLVTHFRSLLAAIIRNAKLPLYKYQYISEGEKVKLLKEFNNTKFKYRKKNTLIDLFQEQVACNPNKIALKDEIGEHSYKAINISSDKIAGYLQESTKRTQLPLIGVMMNRSCNLIATLLGILKSGNAYIPLDPSFPKARLKYIIDHSGIRRIIGSGDMRGKVDFKWEFLDIEAILRDKTHQFKIPKLSSAATAYLIYTSGSTGKPKGVAVSHQSLLNFLISMQHQPQMGSHDFLFSITTPSFDISILEFFTPLISGATVYMASPALLADPLNLIAKLDELKPTIIQATPSFYQMLCNAGWNGNKITKILCGGDLLSETLAEKLIEISGEVWNMYGPTESTIWSSCKRISQPKDALNIGKPIHNTKFYILDEFLQLLPIGSIGNIHIGGDGVAQGYFKNKKLTNEKFIPNPFEINEKIYETGDLGKWNENGELVFFGRTDQQVKLRGYRIELGEIETHLNEIEIVEASVVVAKKNRVQEVYLVGYVICKTQVFKIDDIVKELQKTLPAYMIPSNIVPLSEFPFTPNGKIDRKALALQEQNTETKIVPKNKPITDTEIALYRYYKEALEITEELSVTDDFFALGGHSLNAIKLLNRIDEELKYKITLKDIFDHPSIKMLSDYLEKIEKRIDANFKPIKGNTHNEITSAQYSIWLASLKKERSIAYNMPAAFRISGIMDKTVLEQVFQELLEKYEILRTNFIEIDGVPRQNIGSDKKLNLTIDEFFSIKEELMGAMESYVHKAFDLENEILLRVALFHQKNKSSYLVFCIHHIVMDGWSLEILIREFVSRYKAIINQKEPDEQGLKFQFKDYVAWLQRQLSQTDKRNIEFWNTYLHQYSWKPIIPYHNEFSEKQNQGDTYKFKYELIKLSKLNTIAHKQKVSLHTLLLASFNLLLYKLYGQTDLCVGTVNSGRTLSTFKDQLGMFVKTLPLRTVIDPKQSFSEMVRETHQNILKINDHQDLPEIFKSKVRLNILLVLQNPSYDYTKINIDKNLNLRMCNLNLKYSRLPLLINILGNNEFLSGSMDFNRSLYKRETIDLINLKYEKLLEQIIKDPDQPIGSIDIQLDFENEKSIDINFEF